MKGVSFALFCAAACCTVGAAEKANWQRIDVPNEIAPQEELRAAPSGWRMARDERPHLLVSATFFDGPPEEQASLAFDRQLKRKDGIARFWRFDAGTKGGTWLQLGYAASAVTLARRLPPGTAECRIEFDPGVSLDGHPQIKAIDCR